MGIICLLSEEILQFEEVLDYLLSYLAALLWMELRCVEVVLLNGSGVVEGEVRLGDGVFLVKWNIETMYEIYEVTVLESFEQRRNLSLTAALCELKTVPSHLRNLVFMLYRLEALHVHWEYTDAVSIAFLGVIAEQLLSDTDAKHRLLELANQSIKVSFAKISHSVTRLTLSRENDFVGRKQFLRIVSQQGVYAESLHCVDDREDVACIVFYY